MGVGTIKKYLTIRRKEAKIKSRELFSGAVARIKANKKTIG
jgi:hypothetical protein